jgi:hypothetical protein
MRNTLTGLDLSASLLDFVEQVEPFHGVFEGSIRW